MQAVVPPGQTARRENTWADLLANLSAGKYRGVILVSAYGYHSITPNSYKDHELYAGNKDAFLTSLLGTNRQDELDILRRLVPHLTASGGKVWLLSVVSKEDLWVDDRQSLERWLSDEYSTQVASIARQKGIATFRHELIPVSLVIGNFVTQSGEVLRKNTAGYDHKRSVESIRRLLEVIDALRAWETGS